MYGCSTAPYKLPTLFTLHIGLTLFPQPKLGVYRVDTGYPLNCYYYYYYYYDDVGGNHFYFYSFSDEEPECLLYTTELF